MHPAIKNGTNIGIISQPFSPINSNMERFYINKKAHKQQKVYKIILWKNTIYNF